jgi:hypothetical protein
MQADAQTILRLIHCLAAFFVAILAQAFRSYSLLQCVVSRFPSPSPRSRWTAPLEYLFSIVIGPYSANMFTRILAVGFVGLVLASSADECASQESCHGQGDEVSMLQAKKEVAAIGAEEGSHSRRLLYTFTGRYPTYDGGLVVQGSIGVGSNDSTQWLTWSLSGVDPLCTAVGEKNNSCGVHIHKGTTCADATTVGGHYWNANYTPQDPWMVVTYKAAAAVAAAAVQKCPLSVKTGLTFEDIVGRVMVVHDYNGSRVACAVLGPIKLQVASFVKYFNYPGKLAVGGSVGISGSGGYEKATQTLSWRLSGLDERCQGGPNATKPNSCGVHIHAGKSCDSNAFDHYWNVDLVSPDPWMNVTYKGCLLGHSRESGVAVVTGFLNAELNGHVMIVHDFDGARVACGLIAP